jgi:adenylate kinase family enzyme
MRDICITGLPGAGKGTLATNLQALAVTMGIECCVIVTGDIAREISKESLETGAFAPENEMRRRIREQIKCARDNNMVVVMEGFPRTAAQLVLAEQILERPLYVIMETSPMTCIRRLIGRGRQDDTADAIGRRIVEHQQIVGEVMNIVREGEKWEDWLAVPNNDEIHCRQISISAEW